MCKIKLIHTYKEKLRTDSNKFIALLFGIEVLLIFLVWTLNKYIIEDSLCKSIIARGTFGVGFISWLVLFITLKTKVEYFKYDSQNIRLCKAAVKIFFVAMIYIHFSLVLYRIVPAECQEIAALLVEFYMLKEFLNVMFKLSIGMMVFIFIFACSFMINESKFTLVLITFGGYYLINWLSSEDSLYFFSRKCRRKIKFNVNSKLRSEWATQKSNMLFILIATNFTFGISNIIDNKFKEYLIENATFILLKVNAISNAISNLVFNFRNNNINVTNLDKGWISSVLIAFSIAIMYFLLRYMLVNRKTVKKIPIYSTIVKRQFDEVERQHKFVNTTRIKVLRAKKKRKTRNI